MLKSMTGFGRAEQTIGEKTYLVEIKSLNGKQLEVQLRLAPLLKPYEFEIRSLIQEQLLRGSIECNISIKQNGTFRPVNINTDLIRTYYRQLSDLAAELQIDTNAVLSSLLRLPEVVTPASDMLDGQEYQQFSKVLQSALDELNRHRREEGAVMQQDLLQRVNNIHAQEEEILRLEPRRIARIREEIGQLLQKYVGAENYDANRLEQELIYYMEKIDIHEEQVRLRQHCAYFKELLSNNDESKGKKLSFIIQEMGREINTTGSKAYDADIQKSVVAMKDELEKAKELVLNVL
jgi:uncharacterized protein (TIGR00255 family)